VILIIIAVLVLAAAVIPGVESVIHLDRIAAAIMFGLIAVGMAFLAVALFIVGIRQVWHG
jgi:hypothetical protein